MARVLEFNPEKEQRDRNIDKFRASFGLRKIVRKKINCLGCDRLFKSEDVCIIKMCEVCRQYN